MANAIIVILSTLLAVVLGALLESHRRERRR